MSSYPPRLFTALLLAGSVGMVFAGDQGPVNQATGNQRPGDQPADVQPQGESVTDRVVLSAPPRLTVPVSLTPEANAADASRFIGAAGCSAVNCHGERRVYQGRRDESAYSIWMEQDKHSQSHQVLFNEKSQQIAKLLALHDAEGRPVPAHQATECLTCHSVVADAHTLPDNQHHQLADGVSCEACHGGARDWVAAHHTHDWKNPAIWSDEDKRKAGFKETKNLVKRAELCVSCHVGSPAKGDTPARDVNHDLIAAGHPRMGFEFSAYHAKMPQHWDRNQDKLRNSPSLEARLWAIGQVVSAKTAVELLKARAGDEKAPWPEFSEYGCFACHHGLRSPSWRQDQETPGGGKLEWGTWHFSFLPRAVESLASQHRGAVSDSVGELSRLMQERYPDRMKVGASVDKLHATLQDLVEVVRHDDLRSPSALQNILVNLTRDRAKKSDADLKTRDCWESEVQLYLALVAVRQGYLESQGRSGGDAIAQYFKKMRSQLRFPLDQDSPRESQPDWSKAVNSEIDQIRQFIIQHEIPHE